MTIETAPALYRESRAGAAADACPAIRDVRIDTAQQARRQRAAVVSSFFSGASLMAAAGFWITAYATTKDAVPPLVIGSFIGLAGAVLGVHSVGVSGRLIGYLRGSEELIYFLGDKVLRLDEIIIGLRLRESVRNAQDLAGEADDGRWDNDCPSSAEIIPINKLN